MISMLGDAAPPLSAGVEAKRIACSPWSPTVPSKTAVVATARHVEVSPVGETLSAGNIAMLGCSQTAALGRSWLFLQPNNSHRSTLHPRGYRAGRRRFL